MKLPRRKRTGYQPKKYVSPQGVEYLLIYPDTLRYRDSFNLQILMRYAFKI